MYDQSLLVSKLGSRAAALEFELRILNLSNPPAEVLAVANGNEPDSAYWGALYGLASAEGEELTVHDVVSAGCVAAIIDGKLLKGYIRKEEHEGCSCCGPNYDYIFTEVTTSKDICLKSGLLGSETVVEHEILGFTS